MGRSKVAPSPLTSLSKSLNHKFENEYDWSRYDLPDLEASISEASREEGLGARVALSLANDRGQIARNREALRSVERIRELHFHF